MYYNIKHVLIIPINQVNHNMNLKVYYTQFSNFNSKIHYNLYKM